jgi:hypothetical protein
MSAGAAFVGDSRFWDSTIKGILDQRKQKTAEGAYSLNSGGEANARHRMPTHISFSESLDRQAWRPGWNGEHFGGGYGFVRRGSGERQRDRYEYGNRGRHFRNHE